MMILLNATHIRGRQRDVADPSVGVVGFVSLGNTEVLDLEVGHIVHRDFE
jgi:hypothetical protein